MLHVSWLSIALAALAGFLLGGVWFQPFAFGKLWASFLHTTAEQRRKNQTRAFSITLLTYVLIGWVLAEYLSALQLHGWESGALQGLFLGVGIAASNGLVESAFKVEPFPQFLIEWGCQVATMVLMGAIVGLWA